MRAIRIFVATIAFVGLAVPAFACLTVSSHARSWAQCAYKSSFKTKDHRFMVNFAVAKATEEKLLPTAQPRWDKLEKAIVQSCGRYADVAEKDGPLNSRVRVNGASGYVPKDQYWAIMDTRDIDKLVKK